MTRKTHRFITATASVAVLACMPGLTGIASAHDFGTRSDDSGSISQVTLSPAQQAAVANARDAYFASTEATRVTLKTALDGFRAAVTSQTSVQRDAANTAFEAYRTAKDADLDTTTLKAAWESAYKTYQAALEVAKSAYDVQVTAAKTAANAATDAVGVVYVKAITDAFPGQTVPAGLLELPRSASSHHSSSNCDANGNSTGQRDFGRNGGNGHAQGGDRGHDQRDFGRNGGNGHHGSSRGMHR
jgi:hypothetical protein